MKGIFSGRLGIAAVAAAALLIMAAATGCNLLKPATESGNGGAGGKSGAAAGTHDAASPDAKGAHANLTKEQQKTIEGAGVGALKVLESSRGDASGLNKAFMGEALKTMEKSYADDLAAGKVKIRRYGKPKMTVVNYINGLAGVAAQFIDQGYYVDQVSKKIIAPPSNKTFRFIFAMKQEGGDWKVSQIFESDVSRSDPKTKKDGTINSGTQNN